MGIHVRDLQKQTSDVREKKKISSNIFDFFNKDISFSGSGLKEKQKEAFYSGLGMLLSSGIDMRSALKIICEEQTNKKEKIIFEKLLGDLLAGENLSESMKSSGHFSSYESFNISIGEETGRLNEILNDMASYFDNRIRQRRQLMSTFTYPIIVVVTALLVVIFMMNFIVPMFVDIFKRFNGDLPALTRWVMNVSKTFNKNFIYFIFIVFSLIVTFVAVKNKQWYRKYTSSLLMKLPVIGVLLKKIYLARFCHTMALLLKARIPLLRAINLMAKMISFYPFEQALIQFEDDIMHGKTLYQSMGKFTLFDSKIKSLTKVGEEINQLGYIYENLNKQYNSELQHQIGLLNSLLEPILIMFVGFFVALILVAMYLPMFQMSNSFI